MTVITTQRRLGVAAMVFSEYAKTRILFYHDQGCRPLRIAFYTKKGSLRAAAELLCSLRDSTRHGP